MRLTEHLDYLAISPGGPVDATHPCKAPCNDFITPTVMAVAAIVASAASTTYSVIQSRNAAKQAEYNAEAEAKALQQQATQEQMQFEENQRRRARRQQAFRSAQLARIGQSGFFSGTGTTLELEADTWQQQQRELSDAAFLQGINQAQIGYRAGTALELGKQQASQLRAQATGQIIGGVGDVISIGARYAKTKDEPPGGGGGAPPAGSPPAAGGKG